MQQFKDDLISFFQNQGFVIVSTVDAQGMPHSSCKGIIKIVSSGQIYLLDLYHGNTYKNIMRNPKVSITAVDEHKFKGYCLKGTAGVLEDKELGSELMKLWEDRITGRLTQRLLKNIGGEKGHPRHPEVLLPEPKYLIAVQVEEIVDLTPHHIKER